MKLNKAKENTVKHNAKNNHGMQLTSNVCLIKPIVVNNFISLSFCFLLLSFAFPRFFFLCVFAPLREAHFIAEGR